MRSFNSLVLAAATLVLAGACALFSQIKFSNKIMLSGGLKLSSSSSAPPILSICTAYSTICSAITLTGDPYSHGTFAGYADPSIRQDPQTGTLFMAYSWPNSTSGASAIETHLSKSTDGGATWNYVGAMYPSVTATNPTTHATNYSSNEVVNLLPVVSGGTTYWIAIRLNYWQPAGGASQPYTSRFGIAVAAGNATTGPYALAGVTPQYLGSNQNNDANYPVDVNMQSPQGTPISALSTCTSFREPALRVDTGGNLVLMLGCGTLHFTAQYQAASPIAGGWSWNYITGSNTFATQTDANSLCSYTNSCAYNLFMTEPDMATNKAASGTVLPVSLVRLQSGQRISTGCVVAELDTSSLPYTFKRSGGNIIVDATVLSPDSRAGGPGSCTYDPNSSTGVIIAHKETNCASGTPGCTAYGNPTGNLFTYLMQSLLTP